MKLMKMLPRTGRTSAAGMGKVRGVWIHSASTGNIVKGAGLVWRREDRVLIQPCSGVRDDLRSFCSGCGILEAKAGPSNETQVR